MKVRAEVICRFIIEYEDDSEENINIIKEEIEGNRVDELVEMQIDDSVEIIQVRDMKVL